MAGKILPFKRDFGEDSSLLRPLPSFKGEPRISVEMRILMKRLCVFIGFFVMIFILLGLMNAVMQLITFEVHFDTDKILRRTSDKFLSLGLDTSLIKAKWHGYNENKLVLAAKHLSPAHLRIGGTDSDRLLFSAKTDRKFPSKDYDEDDDGFLPERVFEDSFIIIVDDSKTFNFPDVDRNYDNFTLTGEDWINLHRFSKLAGLDILFDLNVLLRNGDGWDTSNAEELIKFSSDHGLDVDWQLGNEPNSFHHVFNVTINGTQLGKDFNTLRGVLRKYPRYANNTLMVGPDVTRPKKFPQDSATRYLTEFLESVDNVDAVTWHHYYLNGRNTSLAEFVDPQVFNILRKQIDAMKAVTDSLNVTSPMWLAETASAYGGGAPNLSDSFVDGFLWLDKLGISAQMGLDVVIRQSLFQGHYALLDDDMNPLPDYWVSVLYKKLVGPEVIDTTESVGPVRVYCHCTAPGRGTPGTMTVFGINMTKRRAILDMRMRARFDPHMRIQAYVLTGATGLLSKKTLLNGKELAMNGDGTLPPFQPVSVFADDVVMPSESIAFFVLHELVIPACSAKLW